MINQTRYSSMNDRIAPGFWSPFVSTIIPSYHTSHRYLWKIIIIMICLFIPNLPVKRGMGGGVEAHPSPEETLFFLPCIFRPHIRFQSFGLPDRQMIDAKNFCWELFLKSAITFCKNLCLNFFKSSQQIYLLSINFSTGRPKFHNLVYGFNMHGRKC